MINNTEKKLGNELIADMSENTRKVFNKHNIFFRVAVKSICQQRDVIKEYGDTNYQNVLDYIHNTLNYNRKG